MQNKAEKTESEIPEVNLLATVKIWRFIRVSKSA